ncbi:hypothetical protein BDV96DRAFT_489185 [Lophiotrema nucula]|uniref:LsmAD domain-containing protein n=1 Tax=Lophiotrema nucula TaxID=690887 RepID=A0A6A5ZE41_9PLEO|nr:hypothetical protein BDV96DRAFT_489185 [Lophiotrema nucula]
MSSAAAAAAAPVNGSNVNGPPSSTASPNSAGGRAQLKMSTAGKGADGTRKQAGSPVDGGQRARWTASASSDTSPCDVQSVTWSSRATAAICALACVQKPPAQKAWTQGTNPITQRSSNINNSNGVVNAPKPPQNSLAFTGETASPMRHLNDRMMFLLANLSGRPGNITLKNGEKFTGVLSGTSLDPSEMRYVFKMVKKVQVADTQVNGTVGVADDYVGVGDYHVMAFDIGDVADFNVANVVLDKSQPKAQNASSGFRTDTDISGSSALRERNLQKWEPSADTNVDLSLESSGHAGWDQFQENEKLFGLTSNYDESYYTTTINRNDPQYAQRAARAEKIAREIEASSAMNAHVREERGGQSGEDKGDDEEEKYSGVRRDFPPLGSGGNNKYTPPARRPPTGLPTVPGAPVDPAIISSQLARSDSASTKATSPGEKRVVPEPAKADASSKPDVPAPSQVDLTKEAPKADIKHTAPTKPAADQAQKPSSALKPTVGGLPARKPGRPDNATANVEHDLLDSFKQFSAAEKLRMSERQRSIARESKAVKLNDLKKFSQNFKLNTPVPADLVPILAKDETKQLQIVEKARRTLQEIKTTPPKPAPASLDTKPVRPAPAKADTTQASPSATVDRQQNQRPRPVQNHYTSSTGRGTNPSQPGNQASRGPGLLSTRLALNQQQHKQQGGVPYNNIPHPIPPPDMRIPSGPSASSSGVGTPTSGVSRGFNVGAPAFKPNPAANTFQPTTGASNNSSPRPESSSKPEPPRKQITGFFNGQRPPTQPLDLNESFNPIKRMLREAQKDNKTKEYASNGGIPPPYKTQPRWEYESINSDKPYEQLFERPSAPQPVSAPHNMMGNGSIPHQHQLPLHLQGPQSVPSGATPQHTPRHPPVQPHHGSGGPHHFDGQHMQFSHSQSSVHPSPRPMQQFIYNGQPQGMPQFPNQVPMQPYGMSPGVQRVALHQQGGPPFMNPQAPGMGGHMMTNQPSNGPFMGMPPNPQMHMYSPAPPNAYPQYPGHMAGAPSNSGFPSPRPGAAPMMSHQGSQQGHQPQMVYVQQQQSQMQPMFTNIPPGSMTQMRGQHPQPHQQYYGSPHQHHQFPQAQAHRGTPSGSYSQPVMQQHSLQPQVPPTGPANHGPEGNEDVK